MAQNQVKGKIDLDISKFLSEIKSAKAEINKLEKEIKQNFKIDVDGVDKAEKEVSGLNAELKSIQDTHVKLELDAENAKKEIESLKNQINEIGETGGGGGLADALGLSGGMLAIGGAVAGIGLLTDRGAELAKSYQKMAAMSGLAGEELDNLKNDAKELFQQGLGENIQEANMQLANAHGLLKNFLEPTEIKEFIKTTGGIAKTFELDVNEVITKSRTLISQFGLDGSEAARIIADGMQNARGGQEDFLDTISEYSQQFKKAGWSAQEFVSFLKAADKAGSWNLDKAADSVKEIGIRLSEGKIAEDMAKLPVKISGAATQGLLALEEQARKGEISTLDMMQGVSRIIESSGYLGSNLGEQIMIAFGGTPTEDATTHLLVNGFLNADSKAIGNAAKNQFDSAFGVGGFDGLKRSFMLIIDEIANTVYPALEPIFQVLSEDLMPLITQILEPIKPILTNLLTVVSDVLGQLMAGLMPLFQKLMIALQPILDVIIQLVNVVLASLMPILQPIIEMIVNELLPIVTKIYEKFNGLIKQILPILAELLSAVGEIIAEALMPIIIELLPIFEAVAELLMEMVITILPILLDLIKILIPIIKNLAIVTSTILRVALSAIVGVVQIINKLFQKYLLWLQNIYTTIRNSTALTFLRRQFASVYDIILKVIDGIQKAIGAIKSFFRAAKKETPKMIQVGDSPSNATQAAEYDRGQEVVMPTDNIRTPIDSELASAGGSGGSTKKTENKAEFISIIPNELELSSSSISIDGKLEMQGLEQQFGNFIDTEIEKSKDFWDVFSEYGIEALSGFDKYFDDFGTNIDNSINQLKAEKSLIQANIAEIENQIAALQEKKLIGEISYNEFAEQMTELEKQKTELEDQYKNIGDTVSAAITDSLKDVFENFAIDAGDGVAMAAENVAKNIVGLRSAFTELEHGAKGAMDNVQEKFTILQESSTELFAAVGMQLAGTLGQAIADSENFGQIMIKSAFSILDSLIPILTAQIFGITAASPANIATLNTWGAVQFVALTAALKGLVAIAKNAAGAQEGVVGIDKNYSTPPGPRDSIPTLLEPGETVIKRANTLKYNHILKEINAGTYREKSPQVIERKGSYKFNHKFSQLRARGRDMFAVVENEQKFHVRG